VEPLHGGLVCLGVVHITNEFGVLQYSRQGLQSRDLEAESGRFEAVGTRRVRGHGVSDHIAINHVLVAPETCECVGIHTWGAQYIARLPSVRLSRAARCQPVLLSLCLLLRSYPNETSSARISLEFSIG